MRREIIRPLKEKVEPQRAALCVVDVQNDFCSPGGFMDREGQDLGPVRAMLPLLDELIHLARERDVAIIYTQASYGVAGDPYLSPSWLDRAARVNRGGAYVDYPVCREGDWGFELIKELPVLDGDRELRLEKHRYSAFVGTELDLLLRSRGIETVIFAGVATNVCVESTARDAFMRDYFVVVVGDCCASYTKAAHNAALQNLRTYFGEVIPLKTLGAAWAT